MTSVDTPAYRVTRETHTSTTIRDDAEIRYAVADLSTALTKPAGRPRTSAAELRHQQQATPVTFHL